MEFDSGTVVVVTGAASGIGRALSEAFTKAGCQVVLADVQDDALAAAEQELQVHGTETLAVRTDVSKLEEVEALAAAATDRFGKVNVVCNNAGVAAQGDPWIGPLEAWEWTMGVNFWGVVFGVRTFLPRLVAAGGGHIVNTASIAGLMPGFSPPYDASKHAVVAITEDLYNNMQAAQLPIGVSCLCPGWVRTGILEADRNWPTDLGAPPTSDAAQEVTRGHVRRAIDEGMQPAAVADLVLDAVRADRFWVFPHNDFLELAMDRFHRIGEAQNPQPADEVPGMPSRSEILAEVMAAMAQAALD
ncbi:MAG: SDR family NAD(P)-dependent oxidoreductase [Acidimicrobiia bacterium]|nr:SDR family NAD(P)-dependent oxidoreductase [Acidimicrobiia bacterium]